MGSAARFPRTLKPIIVLDIERENGSSGLRCVDKLLLVR
jgi:hypothetical protein